LTIVVIAFAGGVLAIAASFHAGMIFQTLRRTGLLVLLIVTGGRLGARTTLDTPGSLAVPYGVAIAVGAGLGWIGGFG
jgi:hypothetical protein